MSQKVLFSGGSLQQAILAAARHFGLEAEDVAYRARDQRQGIVRGRQRVVIEVDPVAPRVVARPAANPAPATSAAAPPAAVSAPVGASRRERSTTTPRPIPQHRPARTFSVGDLPTASGPESEAVQMALQHLAALAGVSIEARVLQAPDALYVDLGGESRASLLAEDATLLEALEQLLPRTVRGLHGAVVPLTVDSGGVREQLLEDLRRLALEAAERVRQTGQAETLEEMNPAERRIVHMTLADALGVATESLGGGVIKRVQIRPR